MVTPHAPSPVEGCAIKKIHFEMSTMRPLMRPTAKNVESTMVVKIRIPNNDGKRSPVVNPTPHPIRAPNTSNGVSPRTTPLPGLMLSRMSVRLLRSSSDTSACLRPPFPTLRHSAARVARVKGSGMRTLEVRNAATDERVTVGKPGFLHVCSQEASRLFNRAREM